MELFDGALEQVAEHVGVDGLDEIIVGAGVDDFKGGGFGFVGTENNNEGVDIAARQAIEQMDAFFDAARTDGHGQQEYVEFRFLQQLVGVFVVFTFEHFKMRTKG